MITHAPSLEEATQILLQLSDRYDSSGQWRRFWQIIFSHAAKELDKEKDHLLQERLIQTVSTLKEIAPLMGKKESGAAIELEKGIRKIEDHTRSAPYLEISLDEFGQSLDDDKSPLRIMLELNRPFAEIRDRKIAFFMPCCMSSQQLLSVYTVILKYVIAFRGYRTEGERLRSGEEFLARLNSFFEVSAAIGIPRDVNWYSQDDFTELKGYPFDWLIAVIKSKINKKTPWLYPLLDSTEFYFEASQFYGREALYAQEHGGRASDVFIVATSPGVVRPDEYLGDLYPAIHSKIGSEIQLGGLFALHKHIPLPIQKLITDGLHQRWDDFVKDIIIEGRLEKRKNVARGLYFDNGIGVQTNLIQRHYITSEAAMSEPKERDKWSFQTLQGADGRVLEVQGPEYFISGSKQLFNFFVNGGCVNLYTVPPDELGLSNPKTGMRPKWQWPRFLTLVGRHCWVLSLRPPDPVSSKISHGLLISWQSFKETALDPGSELYGRWQNILRDFQDILFCWDFPINSLPCEDGVEVSVDSLTEQVMKELRNFTGNSQVVDVL